MNSRLKNQLAAIGGAAFAVMMGWWVGSGEYGLPLVVSALSAAVFSIAVVGLSFDVVITGLLLVGYIVGNRGFAQISVAPGLPLLPAEAGLAIGLSWLAISAAMKRKAPWRFDALNFAVLAWILVGAIRIVPDMRAYGAMALRDFAMVYYALFFFIAQRQAETDRSQAFLRGCLLVATVIAIPLFELFRRYPEFFVDRLTVAGIPIIFLKGDLVATFIAGGAVLTFDQYERSHRRFWLIATLAATVEVLTSDSRASLIGLAVATGWLALARRVKWLKFQGLCVGVGLIALLAAAVIGALQPGSNPVRPLLDRVASIVDFSGTHVYSPDEQYKADNNRFRLIWWRTVIEQTNEQSPLVGLGFGYDLAAEFTRLYYPDTDEEFSARSPHSILVTAYGRLGAIGASVLLLVIAALARRTWKVARQCPEELSDWLLPWIILSSACFGVVLEGPMGAVIFWVSLGVANARTSTPAKSETPLAPDGLPSGLVSN